MLCLLLGQQAGHHSGQNKAVEGNLCRLVLVSTCLELAKTQAAGKTCEEFFLN